MIQVRDIKKTYRLGSTEVRALDGVSLSIRQGEFIAIMGPSGSGKSTLMHVLGLLDVPDSGSYRLLEQEVAGLDEDDLAGLRSATIGFVFQQFNLLARTSALENVSLPRLYNRLDGRNHNAEGLLREVGLGDRAEHRPNELSGGQQQRVAIARALVNGPRILFADEPTGNLDSASSEEIMGLLDGLNRRGITVILVTHEAEIAAHARRIIRLRDGKVQSDEVVRRKAPAPLPPPAAVTRRRTTLRSLLLLDLLDYFRQAARALLSNKVRSGLSMLGILIGVAAVIAMMAIGAGAQKAIKSRLSSLGSNLLMLFPGPGRQGGVSLGAGSYTRFTPDDVNAIRGLSMVRRASAEVRGRGQIVYGGKNWSTSVQGADPDYAAMRAATPIYGRFFTELENAQRARVVVVGATIVRELFGAANPIGEVVRINRQSFQIIGILPQKGASGWHDEDDNVIVPTATAMYRMQGKDYVDSISVEVVSEDRMEAAQEQISALMRRRSRTVSGGEDGFQIRNMAEIQSAVSETSRAFSTLLAAIAAISLLVGGIGIMNIMLVSVTERTREIGLRKAVGARRKDILSQFLIEAVVVSVTGGATGIAVGWGISRIVTGIAGWATDVSPVSVLLAVLFSAGVGVAFGLWPAWKASRLSPIDALRYE